ncbi:hypothetical protein Pan44_44730 [Caulifigura coniformis]|uniref:Uncharacterized protein n=1 Tax=Caulifigura coniformis TaxID=2527983 RepID=A0A517SJX1_9PLAN|nr:hypothetical protein [Caulifigura coniformis]QDT56419.1 hypothetical protein Pan44_44730 [Caulifigura coniformis]
MPSAGEHWQGVHAFAGFLNVDEVVTLDSILCPDVVSDLSDEDWNHNVHKDFRIFLFRDPAYLTARQPLDPTCHQLLAVLERPQISDNVPRGFARCGFDIVDSCVGNSTLTNCGPIPEMFDPSIVNELGLIADLPTALEVRDRMRKLSPNDDHLGACEVWLIARRLPGR